MAENIALVEGRQDTLIDDPTFLDAQAPHLRLISPAQAPIEINPDSNVITPQTEPHGGVQLEFLVRDDSPEVHAEIVSSIGFKTIDAIARFRGNLETLDRESIIKLGEVWGELDTDDMSDGYNRITDLLILSRDLLGRHSDKYQELLSAFNRVR